MSFRFGFHDSEDEDEAGSYESGNKNAIDLPIAVDNSAVAVPVVGHKLEDLVGTGTILPFSSYYLMLFHYAVTLHTPRPSMSYILHTVYSSSWAETPAHPHPLRVSPFNHSFHFHFHSNS